MGNRARGRPRQGQAVKDTPINIRTSSDLRRRVENAARANRRSLAQEVEQRLYLTFDWEADQHNSAVARAALRAAQGGHNGDS